MTWRFFNKLIFAVETSNEQELDDILKRRGWKMFGTARDTDLQLLLHYERNGQLVQERR